MKKKFAALMLAAMLSVSLTACSGKDDNKNSAASQTASTASAAEKADEAPAIDYEVNESVKKAIDDNLSADKLGKKTKYTIDKFAAKELDIKVSFTIENEGSESSESSAQANTNPLAALSGSEIKLSFAKNNDNDIRADINFSGITMDILSNKDGIYFLDSSAKIATHMPSQNTSEEASEAGTSATEKAASQSLLPSIDSDSIKDTLKSDKNKFEYTGDGEGEFNGKKYSYEGYSISMSGLSGLSIPGMTAGESSTDKKDEEVKADMKLYFDEYDLKGIEFNADKTKVLLTVNTFNTMADSSLFVLPEGYKVKEDDGTYIMKLLSMFSAFGTGSDTGTDENIITAD